MTLLRKHLSYANVMATIAVFFAVGGGAAYATHLVVRSSDIVDNEVRSVDVRNDSLAGGGLTAPDLRAGSVGTSEAQNNSLTGADINESTLAFGQAQLTFADRLTQIGAGARPSTSTITTPPLPAGAYAVTAKVDYALSNNAAAAAASQMRCGLENSAGTDGYDESIASLLAQGDTIVSEWASMPFTLTGKIPANGRFVLTCTHLMGADIALANRKIMAVRQVSHSQAAVTPSDSG